MSEIAISVIISTYNSPEWLAKVLHGYNNQTYQNFEVVIADDGSTEKTKILIESFQNDFPVPLKHIWHEDMGFTKSIILNKAVANSIGDYIIQIDGDCIIHKNFVKDHIEYASTNMFLYGSRVTILESHLITLFKNKQTSFNVFSAGIKKRTRALYLPFLSLFYNKKHEVSKKYRGCNTSYFKSDFISINGYDERFKGWGREDSELAWRFYNKGLISRRLRYRGILFHIFHIEKSKGQLKRNNEIEIATITEKKIWCENGINKYLNEKK